MLLILFRNVVVLIRLLSLLLVLSFAFVGCGVQEVQSSEQPPETTLTSAVEEIDEPPDDDEPIEYNEIELIEKAENNPQTHDKIDEIITEPLFLTLDRDLTEEDIAELKQYKEITLFIENEIDVSLLSQLENLEILNFYQGENQGPFTKSIGYISDFSFLCGLNLKELYLNCGSFNITLNDLKLEHLEKLTIYSATIIDEEMITSLPNLKDLFIYVSDFKSIDPFCGLNLTKLQLFAFGIEQGNIDRINEITSLEELSINYVRSDFDTIKITSLNGLSNLIYLSIPYSEIDISIDVLYEIPTLETLRVHADLMTDEQINDFKKTFPRCEFYIWA